jgi:hypothetical protein
MIGEELGLGRERVRQIRRRAETKLKLAEQEDVAWRQRPAFVGGVRLRHPAVHAVLRSIIHAKS